jgi:hypothetical protein
MGEPVAVAQAVVTLAIHLDVGAQTVAEPIHADQANDVLAGRST